MRVAVFYRVIQDWRAPVFERLARLPGWEIKVFHGCDFAGTKVVNAHGPFSFPTLKMWSFPIKVGTGSGGDALVPLSPLLFWHLVKFRPDVIVCEGASNTLNNLAAFAYAKIFRVPIVQWGLGRIRGRRRSPLRAVADILVLPMERRSDAIISYSATGAEYFRSIGVPDSKVFVATNVVDTDQRLKSIEAAASERSQRMADFNILFVGALQKEKRVDLLIRAFGKLQVSTEKRVSLTIIGDGPVRPDLEQLTLDVGAKNVFFRGKILNGISRFFLDSDVFVLPGLGGLAVSDALVHGVPVICSTGDGSEADLIKNGINGFFEPNMTEEVLLRRLRQLADDPRMLSEMKKNAYPSLQGKDVNAYIETIGRAVHSAFTI